jgi:putative redox protein
VNTAPPEGGSVIQGIVTLTQPQSSARQFVGASGTGHHLLIDDAAGNSGAKPIELIAIGLAGCTAFDVINILRKKRQDVVAYSVHVEADQADTPPQVFTNVRIHHQVVGDVTKQALEDAIRLSEDKYCSVGAMIQRSGAAVHTTFEVVPAEVLAGAGA